MCVFICHPLLVQVRRSIMPSWICGNRPLEFRLKTAVLLLFWHASHAPSLSAYVMLSRVRSYSGLALLGYPAKDILFQKPDTDYLTFMNRIDDLAQTTWRSLSTLAVDLPIEYVEKHDLADLDSQPRVR